MYTLVVVAFDFHQYADDEQRVMQKALMDYRSGKSKDPASREIGSSERWAPISSSSTSSSSTSSSSSSSSSQVDTDRDLRTGHLCSISMITNITHTVK